MNYFYIKYEDGTSIECQDVVEARYNGADKNVIVSNDEISSHLFPLGKALWLKTETGTYSINGNGIRFITVERQ